MSNLSQEKRKEMLEYINKLKEIHKDDESIIALEKIETALTEKKYGLVWEEHKEEVDKKLVHNIPIFTEVEERKIIADENEGFNFLLEGDNLHSLKLLEKTHKGKIDVIYIDPPYNTGNKDFIYDDNYIGSDDGYRHSKWLSFMNERLRIAKNLLSDQGVIFISIDDNEQAQLKLLCDEVFGENNFIGEYIKQSKVGGGNDSKFIVKEHESCLCYAKNSKLTEPMFIEQSEEYLKRYKEKDEIGRYFWDTFARPGLKNPIVYEIEAPDGTKIKNGWIRSEERFKKEYSEGKIRLLQKADGSWSVQFKQYLNEKGKTPRSFSTDFGGTNDGDSELKEIFGKKVFNYPKSVKFIKTLLSTITNKNVTVLDFFAGSGTTAQAVMELNKSDGGNRKFIICTNNENNICEEVTYERIKRVIFGYEYIGKKKDELKSYKLNISNLKKIDFIFKEIEDIKLKSKNNYDNILTTVKNETLKIFGEKHISGLVKGMPNNLKYFKTDFTPKFSADEDILSLRLLDHIKEMVELENMCEIDGENRVIILSDENLKQNIETIKDGAYLYMPVYILLSIEIKNLIEKKKINLVKIPEYYFMDELREANEI